MTETTEKKPLKCSICQGDIDVGPSGWDRGHNAGPVNEGRCCDLWRDHPTRARSAPAAAPGLLRLTLSERKFEEIVDQLR
jgi:hypothetical protein